MEAAVADPGSRAGGGPSRRDRLLRGRPRAARRRRGTTSSARCPAPARSSSTPGCVEWWRHYGRGAELAVHVAYRGDRLVGALPLCTRRRLGLRVSEFVGGTWAILADALVAPGEDASAVTAGLAERAMTGEHDFVDLFGLPGSSRLVAALPQGSLRLVQRLDAPVCDLGRSWEAAYTARFSSKARSERRRRMRQLERLGTVECSIARSREEIARRARGGVPASMRCAGKAAGIRRGSSRRPASDSTARPSSRLADENVARISTIRLDGRAIAFSLYLQLAGRAYGLTMAFDPAYAPLRPRRGGQAPVARGLRRRRGSGASSSSEPPPSTSGGSPTGFEPVYEGVGLERTLRGRAAKEALVGRDPPAAGGQAVEDGEQALRPLPSTR